MDVRAGIFGIYSRRAQHAFQIAEINDVTATLNRFAKLRVGGEVLVSAGTDQQVSNRREIVGENRSVANEDDVSGGAQDLHVAD